jgi:putative phage-type endonuclease
MKILHLKQNSPEWEEYRRTRIGASDSPTVCGVNPYRTYYALWREKACNEKGASNAAMMDGHRLEPRARQLAEEHYGMEFKPLCVLHDKKDYIMASLDGYNADSHVSLEIKVVGDRVFEQVEFSGASKAWIYQVNHQMECLGTSRAFIFVMNKHTEKFLAFQVDRNQAIIDEILRAAKEFQRRVDEFDEPAPDYIDREDHTWKEAAEQFLMAKESLAEAEVWAETCRQAMIDLAGNVNCRGFGVSACKSARKGAVNYKKVPQLEGVDLNAYRSPIKEIWRVV